MNVPPPLAERTKQFAIRVVHLNAALPHTRVGEIFGSQLVRSAASGGAHFAEASHSKSAADFVSKCQGARQEMEEALYWIDLVKETGLIKASRLPDLIKEGREIVAILVTMTNRAKERLK